MNAGARTAQRYAPASTRVARRHGAVRIHADDRAVRPQVARRDTRSPPSRRGWDFEVIERPLLPVAGQHGSRPQRLGDARRRGARHRAGRADDLRDLPDHALSPGRRGPAGRDARPAQRRPVHRSAWAPARTSTSTSSAGAGRRRASARRCSPRRVDIITRAVRRRLRRLRGRALPGQRREAVGPRRPRRHASASRSPASSRAAWPARRPTP